MSMPCIKFVKSKPSKNISISPKRPNSNRPRRALTIREPPKRKG